MMRKVTSAVVLTIGQLMAITCRVPQAFALEKITISNIGSGSADNWPTYGAMKMGWFKKSGIEVEFVSAPSSAAAIQDLAAGAVDMASSGLVDPLRAIDQGAAISLLRIEASSAPYEVFAKPVIHSFPELKGKIVMVGGIKDVTRTYFERMAVSEGLKPGTYDYVYAGAAAARLAALASGSVDATILNPPFNFKAAAAGLSRLPTSADFAKGLPFTGYSVGIAWAKSHKPLLAKFLAAYSKGIAWFYDPKNRSEAVDVLLKHLKVSKDEAEKSYDFFVSRKVFARHGVITSNALAGLLKNLKSQGGIQGPTNIARFYDADLVAAQK